MFESDFDNVNWVDVDKLGFIPRGFDIWGDRIQEMEEENLEDIDFEEVDRINQILESEGF